MSWIHFAQMIENLHIVSIITSSRSPWGSKSPDKGPPKSPDRRHSQQSRKEVDFEECQNSEFVMSVIKIETKNHFKMIAREAKGKIQTTQNTSWYHGFWNCEAYELFNLKVIDTKELTQVLKKRPKFKKI